jgi:hypothetical protein
MRLSELQIKKISSYLMDVSKLVFGASVIPLFVPGSIFGTWTFLGGVAVAMLSFTIGLLIIKNIE